MSFNLKTEDKVNLGLTLGAFVILLVVRNTAEMNAFEAPKYLAGIGAILGLARWWAANKSSALSKLKNTFTILLMEPDLNKKDLIPVGAPLVYGVTHGLFVGAILGLVVDWVHNLMHKNAFLPQEWFIQLALISLLILLIIRLTLESIYKK